MSGDASFPSPFAGAVADAAPPAEREGGVRGCLDHIRHGAVSGWAFDAAAPDAHLQIAIRVGDRIAAVGLANAYRGDLETGGIGAGDHAFAIPLAARYLEGEDDEVIVISAEIVGRDVVLGPLRLTAAELVIRHCEGEISEVIGPLVRGWAWDALHPDQPVTVEAWFEGRVIASALADIQRRDLEAAGIGDGRHGFELRLPLSHFGDDARHVVVVLRSARISVEIGAIEAFDSQRRLSTWLLRLGESLPADTDPRVRDTVAGLFAYAGRFEARMPTSLPFSDYPAWRDLFHRLPGQAGEETAGEEIAGARTGEEQDRGAAALSFIALVNAQGGAEGLAETLRSLEVPDVAWRAVHVFSGEDAGDTGEDTVAAVLRESAARPGEHVVALKAGERLRPGAMVEIAARLAADAPDILYADEERLGPDGAPVGTHFKPAWNYDLFLATGYALPAMVVAGRRFSRIEDGEGWHDALLRAVEAADPARIAHLPRVLVSAAAEPTEPAGNEVDRRRLAAVERHLARVRPGSTADTVGTVVRVRWRRPKTRPAVSLIIPTRDNVGMLANCVDSLLERSRHDRLEVLIVDNDSQEPASFDYFRRVHGRNGVRVLAHPGPFNYAAMNNRAAGEATGEILGLVNNDILFPQTLPDDWLDEIAAILDRPQVGAVGIKLLYPDRRIQHAGVVLGLDGEVAGHAFCQLPGDEAGYGMRAMAAQRVSAVTAACMFLRRDLYLELGGLDAVHLPVAYNDVDLCLRLGEAGYGVVWTPHLSAFHLESASRGSDLTVKARARLARERGHMEARWGRMLEEDPHYNPNLNLDGLAYAGLAFPPRGLAPGRRPRLRMGMSPFTGGRSRS